MSSRRLARAKRNPAFERPQDQDPSRSTFQAIEHPRLGHVVVRWQGGKIQRVRTEHPPFRETSQNFFGPLSSGGRFEQVLEVLGIRGQ